MKKILALLVVFSSVCFADALTIEQFETKTELDALKAAGKISYKYDASQIGQHSMGYVAPTDTGEFPVDSGYGDTDIPLKEVNLRTLPGIKFPPILNQASCGSCVVFSVTHNAQASLAVRKVNVPPLSPQHLMNCGGQAGQCDGDYGSNVCKRLVNLGSLTSNLLYPYTARSSSCKVKDSMERFGRFLSFKTIPGSFKSILTALNERKPISVGIAADGRFQSYSSGIYDGFGSMGTNHYVLIVGASCGKSKDSNGVCKFDGDHLEDRTEAIVDVDNSWGNWGDNGTIKMQFESALGRRNNNIAGGSENAQIIDTGYNVSPEVETEYEWQGNIADVKMIYSPNSSFNPEALKESLTRRLEAL